jgi:hypothetical protein
MPTTVTLKAKGLVVSPNQLEVPEGSLTEASNVVIRRDNVIEPRRGFKLFGESLPSSSDRAKQLMVYKDRILRHYQSTLQFQDGTNNSGLALFTDFSGIVTEVQEGLRIKSISSQGNFYFTTADGVKKISAGSAADLSDSSEYISNAGGVKAIDLNGYIKSYFAQSSGFLVPDSAVAYRVVWGIEDLNNNLVLGTPSSRLELYNSQNNTNIADFNRVLYALDSINDTGSLITDGNYTNTLKLPANATAEDVGLNLVALAAKIDADILYADNDGAPTGAPLEIDTATILSGVCTLTFASGTATDYFEPGSNLRLTGFTPGTGTLDGAIVVATVGVSQITFNTSATGAVTISGAAKVTSGEYENITAPSVPNLIPNHNDLQSQTDYISEIISLLQEESSFVIPTLLLNAFIIPLEITTSSAVELQILIPSDVNSNYFYQVYRSELVVATGVTVLDDLQPNDELKLVFEGYPTQQELTDRIVVLEDITPEEFRGANLYTNPATGEGILQANDIPPLCKDLNKFKGYTFFANTKTRHRENASLLGVSKLITDYNNSITPKLVIASSDSRNIYSFIIGEQEVVDITTVAAASLVSSASPASYFFINSASDLEEYYVWYKLGSSLDPEVANKIGIQVNVLSGDTNAQVATKTRDALSQLSDKFTATAASNIVTVTNFSAGYTTDPSAETSGFSFSITNQGTGEKAARQQTQVTTIADTAGSLAGDYWFINDTYLDTAYYVWYSVSNVGVDPAIAGKTGIEIDISTNDTAAVVAQKTKLVFDTDYSDVFITEINSNVLTIDNFRYGPTSNATAETSGFTISTILTGALDVLLSNNISPAIAVDETARSLSNILNSNETEQVYAYYLSGPRDVPGKFLLEARELGNPEFYLQGNNSNTGSSFNPDFSPSVSISSISTGSPSTMLVTTATAHGLINQQNVVISGSNSVPNIDGLYSITFVSTTSFRVNKTIVTAGTEGSLNAAINTNVSDNETKPNRLYYSKFQQTEAVPILNFLDVGSEDNEILRIFPLRDSLFVFKGEGLYRVSGESAPFSLGLFDSSCIVNAPDSVSVCNNLIYAWTTQGISTISESGVNVISRAIDTEILKLPLFSGFSTSTWGIGYEQDQAYLVWTVKKLVDTVATICYRYCALTDSWTVFNKTDTCGLVNTADGKLYLGAGDISRIEQERKDFARTDYADREFTINLAEGNFFGTTMRVDSVSGIAIGDVVAQEQELTIYEFNALLKKLDLDPGVSDTDYYTTLQAVGGDNLRSKLSDLATKLDLDTGVNSTDFFDSIDSKTGTISSISVAGPTVITTSAVHEISNGRYVIISGSDSSPTINDTWLTTVTGASTFTIPEEVTSAGTTGTFITANSDSRDVAACYNVIITKLNADTSVTFSNYSEIDTVSTKEAIVLNVSSNTKQLTLNLDLDFVAGELTVYKAITSQITYSPNTMGDPVGLKHLREATLMFINKAFTSATLSFASDLLPAFVPIAFHGDGNGIFGMGTGSFGSGFFGGSSHSAPFRTYIPRNCQRCRYILARFSHGTAREAYGIYGLSITGEISQSSRAYR